MMTTCGASVGFPVGRVIGVAATVGPTFAGAARCVTGAGVLGSTAQPLPTTPGQEQQTTARTSTGRHVFTIPSFWTGLRQSDRHLGILFVAPSPLTRLHSRPLLHAAWTKRILREPPVEVNVVRAVSVGTIEPAGANLNQNQTRAEARRWCDRPRLTRYRHRFPRSPSRAVSTATAKTDSVARRHATGAMRGVDVASGHSLGTAPDRDSRTGNGDRTGPTRLTIRPPDRRKS